MSCKIPYLDNNYQGEQLKQLRNKHISIVKQTIASKLFYRRGGYMQLTADKSSNIRTKQEEFVKNIPELSIIQANNKDVLSLKVDKFQDNAVAPDFNYTTQQTFRDENIERFFDKNGTTTVSSILNKITNPELKLLADSLKKYLTSKQKDVVINLTDLNPATRGLFFGNQIFINQNGKFPKGDASKTILHEIIHLMTSQYLSNNRDEELYKDFKKLYDKAYKELVKDNKPFYGLTNIDEFIAEAFSNSEFIKELSQLDSIEGVKKYDNLFQEFVDRVLNIIKKIFGVKNDNLYNQISDVAAQIISMNSDVNEYALDSYEETVLYDMDTETVREHTEFSKYLAEPENEELFLSMIKAIKTKFDDYIQLLSDAMVEYPSSDKEIKYKELNALRKMLDDSNTEDAIIGLNNYITHSVQWIDSIYNEYFSKDSNVVDAVYNLNSLEEGEAKDKEINRLSKVLNKSKHFLSLFKDLDDFKRELSKTGFIPDDKFNTKLYNNQELFNSELTELGIDENKLSGLYGILDGQTLSTTEFKQIIVNTYFKDKLNATRLDEQDFREKMELMFENNINNTFTSQMSEALGKAERLKKEIADLHYTLATDWLFPLYDKQQSKLKDSEMYVSKKKFKELLRVSDKDESTISSWIEATIQSKDPLVASVAKKIADGLREVDIDNYTESLLVMQERAKNGFDKLNEEEKKQQYGEMINLVDQLVLDTYGNPIKLTDDDIRDGIEIDTLQGEERYLTVKTKAFKTGKHTSLVEAKKALISNLIYRKKKDEKGEEIPSLLNQITDSAFNEAGELDADSLGRFLLDNKAMIPELWELKSLFKTLQGGLKKNEFGEYELNDKLITKLNKAKNTKEYLKSILEGRLTGILFYAKTYNPLSLEDTTNIFNLKGITSQTVNNFSEYINENASKNENIDSFNYLINENKIDSLVHIEENGIIKYLYKDGNGILQLRAKEDIGEITSFYYKKGELTELKPEFLLPIYQGEHQEYFKFLYDTYQKENKKLGDKGNKHGVIPQIEKTGIGLSEIDFKGLFQQILDWIADAYNNLLQAWNDRDLAGEDNEEAKSTFEAEYLNGEKVKKVAISYTTRLENQDRVEHDLSVSVMAFNMMVKQHLKLKSFDAQVQVVRALITGDTLLGIEQRKTRKQDAYNRFIRKRKRGKYDDENYKKDVAVNLNSKLLEFIDEMMYSENDYAAFDFGLGFNSKNASNVIGGYTTFTSLAMNISGMMSNVLNGKVSTYLESVQEKYFDRNTWLESEGIYMKNMAQHYNDFKSPNLQDKSMIGQLSILLDAIQGEYSEGKSIEQFKNKKLSDITTNALYFTQNGAEHYIQTVNMIAMLKATSSPTHANLWEEFSQLYTDGKGVIKIDTALRNRILEFQGNLHSVNKRLNGAYAKIDKSRLQRRWFGRLALMFRKYIWQFYKARFDSEQLDIDSGDTTRGYVREYYGDLLSELQSNRNYFYKAGKVLNQVVTDNKRIALGVGNTLSFGALNKNIDINKMYGFEGKSDKEIKEAQRYIAEMSLFISFTMIAAVLAGLEEGLDDDDENTKFALISLELLAKRQRGDLATFLPTMVSIPTGNVIPGLASANFLAKTIASPIPSLRSYNNLLSTLSQLTSVGYEAEKGINFTFNDAYEQKGVGYEKGDLKIVRKLEKSVVSPLWQILKFMNPEEQLKYLEMVNRNAQ